MSNRRLRSFTDRSSAVALERVVLPGSDTSTIVARPGAMASISTFTPSAGHGPTLTSPAGVRAFDLGVEALDLALSPSGGRTLARLETLRLTLMSVKAGATVQPHKSDHEISIQTIAGHVVLHTQHGSLELPTGRVAVVHAATVHHLEATADSALLITVCVPPQRLGVPIPAGPRRVHSDRSGVEAWNDEARAAGP